MLEGIHFNYDGIHSIDMGLLNVKIGGGMFEETFLPKREIKEIKVDGRDTPYFQKVVFSPLEFSLSFAFEYSYDEKKIREVAQWLNQSYYKPFYTVDNPNRIFYCMPVGDSSLIHNGLKQGYITLTMRCDSPYSYYPVFNNNNNIFDSTYLTTSIVENAFNSGDGIYENVIIKDYNTLELDIRTHMTLRMLNKRTWREIYETN